MSHSGGKYGKFLNAFHAPMKLVRLIKMSL
jgi:hypothetical protein